MLSAKHDYGKIELFNTIKTVNVNYIESINV